MDTRYEKRECELQEMKIDEKERESPPPRERLRMQQGTFLSARPKNHLSTAWLLKWGKTEKIPSPLLRRTLIDVQHGVATDYRNVDGEEK